MTPRPRLDSVRLTAFDGSCDEDAPDLDGALLDVRIVSVDGDEFMASLPPNEIVQSVAIRFELEVRSAAFTPESGPIAELSAEFVLSYRVGGPPDLRDLATRQALLDVWPTWVAWANQQLAAFGLPPSGLPPRPMKSLGVEARQRYDNPEHDE